MVNWKLEKTALMAQKTGSRHRHWLSSLSDQLCVWPPTVIGWREGGRQIPGILSFIGLLALSN